MYKACIIVLSDREYTGEESDNEGRKLEEYLINNNFEILVYKIIPEIKDIYKSFLIKCCDNYCVELVVTIGNKMLSEQVSREIIEEENKSLESYRRKDTIIKNLEEDIGENDIQLDDLMESIKR